jgi:tRNA pseudouridine55 synthase
MAEKMRAGTMQKLTSGILVVDKPEGMSSAGVVGRIKRGLRAGKVGHCGTLDPFASGVVVCCINQATRLAGFFLHGDKRYEGILRLGIETDTQDLTGETGSEKPVDVTADAVRSAFAALEGPMRQHPPVYSALKHRGVPLYKLARAGRPVQKPPREIVIHRLEVQAVDLPDVRFSVSCSGGTYVRTLAVDLGRMLGCGAHLRKLVRTAAGPFSLEQALTPREVAALAAVDAVEDRMIPMNDAVAFMPMRRIAPETARKIRHGMPLTEKEIERPKTDASSGWIRIVDENDRLIAILEHKKGNPRYNYCCVFN